MITLYRTPSKSPLAEKAATVLADLVLAHTIVTVEDTVVDLPPGTELPAIVDDGKVVEASELEPYLEELNRYMAEWSRYQSDACYIDKDNRYC